MQNKTKFKNKNQIIINTKDFNQIIEDNIYFLLYQELLLSFIKKKPHIATFNQIKSYY